MTPDDMKKRTRAFALDVIRFVLTQPKDPLTATLAKQLMKSGTGVASSYRASCRAKSRADFISKMGLMEEETDESALCLDVLIASQIADTRDARFLLDEASQLTAIAVKSITTARSRDPRRG